MLTNTTWMQEKEHVLKLTQKNLLLTFPFVFLSSRHRTFKQMRVEISG